MSDEIAMLLKRIEYLESLILREADRTLGCHCHPLPSQAFVDEANLIAGPMEWLAHGDAMTAHILQQQESRDD